MHPNNLCSSSVQLIAAFVQVSMKCMKRERDRGERERGGERERDGERRCLCFGVLCVGVSLCVCACVFVRRCVCV